MSDLIPTENPVAAVLRERAEREAERVAVEHQRQVDGLMRAIVKRAVLA